MAVALDRSHWFSYDDCCVYVSEKLSVPHESPIRPGVLVFLHGRFGHAGLWGPVIEGLAGPWPGGLQCVSVDLPGFGRSFCACERGLSLVEYANLVNEVVKRFTDTRAILVGHDIGGLIAQLYAIQFPDRLAGLVLINSSSFTQSGRSVRPGLFGLSAYRQLKKLLRGSGNLDDGIKDGLLSSWSPFESDFVHSLKRIEESWPGSNQRRLWYDFLKRALHPALVLWGGRDSLNLSEYGMELARLLPESNFYQAEDSGHWPQLDNPTWITLRMREFLFKINPGVSLVRKSLSR